MKLPAFTLHFVIFSFLFVNAYTQDSLRYGPDNYENFSGEYTELVLVYIGADSCGPCHLQEVKDKIEEYKMDLYNTAQEQGKSFSVVGVANDYSIEKGWNLLKSSGYFDEVIIGKNWKNNGSIEFIWNPKNITPAMPSVVVYERKVHQKATNIEFGEPSIIANSIVTSNYDWDEEKMTFIKNNKSNN